MKNIISLLLLGLMMVTACNSNEAVKKEIAAGTTKDSSMLMDNILSEDTTITETAGPVTKEVELTFNLKKGRSYAYAMDFDMERDMNGQKMKNGMNWRYSLDVIDDKGGIKTLKVTYERLAMVMDMGGQKMEFTSDKAPGDAGNPFNMVSNMFVAMKGKSFVMKVNRLGEITAVEGFDKIGEALVKEMKVPEEVQAKALQNFKSQFNNETVKETFSSSFNIFPTRAVKLGDSWQKKTIAKMGPAKGMMTTTYTVKQINGSKVVLNAVSKIAGEAGVKGTQTSRLIVDASSGLVLQNVFEMKMEGEQKVVSKGKITGKEL